MRINGIKLMEQSNNMKKLDIITALAGSLEQQNFTNYTLLDRATFPAKYKDSESYNLYTNWGRTETTYPDTGQFEVADKQTNFTPSGLFKNKRNKY